MGSRLSILAGLLAGLLVAGALLLGFVYMGPAPAHPSASAAAASDSPAPSKGPPSTRPAPSTAAASPVGSARASGSPAAPGSGAPGSPGSSAGSWSRPSEGEHHGDVRRDAAPQPLIAVAASPMIPMISPGKNPSRIVIAVATASPPHSSRPWCGGSCADTGSRMYM